MKKSVSPKLFYTQEETEKMFHSEYLTHNGTFQMLLTKQHLVGIEPIFSDIASDIAMEKPNSVPLLYIPLFIRREKDRIF